MLKNSIILVFLWLELSLQDVTSFSIVDRRGLFEIIQSSAAGALSTLGVPTVPQVNDDDETLTIKTPINTILSVPQVAYSLYKTDPSEVEQCVSLALEAGVKHFDVATAYGTNALVGNALQQYKKRQQQPQLFITHKISNSEQSNSRNDVKRAVKQQMKDLGVRYLDLAMIHSPLTDRSRRLNSYQALIEMQLQGIVGGVGVCNYGVNPLDEIVNAGLPSPSVIQLPLSPFNQHKDVVTWAKKRGSVMSCGAWSKLSSDVGPQEGWAKVADIANAKGITKAQVLVLWSLYMGYLCAPRSGSKYKIEREAIQQNSYNGIKNYILTSKELKILNSLDEQLPAGRLGIIDGWTAEDISDDTWDPTSAV